MQVPLISKATATEIIWHQTWYNGRYKHEG